jgi:hypothetical protein
VKIDRRRLRWAVALVVAGAGLTPAPVRAETRPFLFTVTPSSAQSKERWTVHYDAGYADRTGQSFCYDGMEQRVGVQGALGHGWTLLGEAGLGLKTSAATRTTQEVELLKDLRAPASGPRLAVGLGLRREWEGSSVLLGRVSAGAVFARSSLFGNLRFERAFAKGRDGLDVVTTVGWLRQAGSVVRLGVEAVGEDLEGLWDREEAEGGAKVFLGPSVHLMAPGRPWSLSLCGGPILYASRSPRASGAPRPLGADGNGYTVRASLGYSF